VIFKSFKISRFSKGKVSLPLPYYTGHTDQPWYRGEEITQGVSSPNGGNQWDPFWRLAITTINLNKYSIVKELCVLENRKTD
jgi:hypothetical protein